MQSIAILPFVNISNNPKDDYLCHAIAIETIHLLSNYKNLRVVAFDSALSRIKKAKLQKDLNVNLILQGSILKIKEHIRVTVQFISTEDDTCLLSVKFEETSASLFELIDNIAIKVVQYLKLEIINREPKPHISPEAYDNYLKGLYYWNLWNDNNVKKAIEFFQKSVEIEPEFALGYARISNCLSLLAGIQKDDMHQSYADAKKSALKAVALDNTLIEAHLALALIKLLNDLDILGAYYSLKKAFSINRYSPEAHYYYAFYLLVIGKYQKAIENIEYALDHDPLNVQINSTYGFALSLFEKYDVAETQLKKTLTFAPESKPTYDALFWTYLLAENYDAARVLVEQEEDKVFISPAAQITLYQLMGLKKEVASWTNILEVKLKENSDVTYYREASIAYQALGDIEKASKYFELLYVERIGFIMALTHPAWKPFRKSRKFYKYKKRLKLVNAPMLTNTLEIENEEVLVINSSTIEKLSVGISELLYIEAESIYSKVVWRQDGEIKEKLLRVSLSKILEQTMSLSLYRCHNSFIINTNIPFKIIGNRKSMKIIPKGCSIQIPVSRTQSSNIQERLIIDNYTK